MKTKRIKENNKEIKENKKFVPYEKKEKLEKLKILGVICPRSHNEFFLKTFKDNGVSLSLNIFGKGTAPSETLEILGLTDNRKSLVIGIIKDSNEFNILNKIKERFSVSVSSKGVAFTTKIESVAGVLIYKFLVNKRNNEVKNMEEVKNNEELETEKENYSLIISIVNRGYNDLVMEAARKKGAMGGTIFNAHGSANIDIEKYFGIPVQPEKEMVFIIVKKEIKDEVLLSIYNEVGLDSKGQGISFAIDLDKVIGLTPIKKVPIEDKEIG